MKQVERQSAGQKKIQRNKREVEKQSGFGLSLLDWLEMRRIPLACTSVNQQGLPKRKKRRNRGRQREYSVLIFVVGRMREKTQEQCYQYPENKDEVKVSVGPRHEEKVEIRKKWHGRISLGLPGD